MAAPARDAMALALTGSGYQVQVAASAPRLRSLVAGGGIDAWIFDARSDRALEVLLPTGRLLLPADNIPNPANRRLFSGWAESLLTQLDLAVWDSRTAGRTRGGDRWNEVQGVWLLAGSAGATSAIQAFLNTFDGPPPVAFLYAQHLQPTQQQFFQNYTLQSSHFSLELAEGVHQLEPARLLMVSPCGKAKLDEFGHLTCLREPWGSRNAPDINDLLVMLSAAKIPPAGVIIFSGMGDDGAEALPAFAAAGGRVWVQSTDSAVCPSMPQAALNTGLVQKSGDPIELARSFERLYRP
jgi:chemosensory pili system protein ChpB (putative protein-glutamate methylesterase)